MRAWPAGCSQCSNGTQLRLCPLSADQSARAWSSSKIQMKSVYKGYEVIVTRVKHDLFIGNVYIQSLLAKTQLLKGIGIILRTLSLRS